MNLQHAQPKILDPLEDTEEGSLVGNDAAQEGPITFDRDLKIGKRREDRCTGAASDRHLEATFTEPLLAVHGSI